MPFNTFVSTPNVFQSQLSMDVYPQKQSESSWAELQHLNPRSTTKASPKRPQFVYSEGWRFGAMSCAISTSVVFLVNLVATIIWAVKVKGGVLHEGDCDQAKRINLGLHILINALSIIMLSSSNYCMQCLSAPTRKETDHAHARGDWLDIGVQSIRNLRRISKKRAAVWCLLGLSSLPLHLL